MGVMGAKGPTKPRPAMVAQRPQSPRAAPATAPRVTAKPTSTAAPRKEEETLRGTSTQSPVKSTLISDITTNTSSRTKIVLAASEAKDEEKHDKKNDQNETENSIVLALGDMSLIEDNDLNRQIKSLSIKDEQKDKEQSEESDLVSRGPDRICTKGNRAAPYLYEQVLTKHIVSADKYGGGTVRYPNISPPHKVVNYPQDFQEFQSSNFQNYTQNSGFFTNGNYINGSNCELENITPVSTEELPHLSEQDLLILQELAEKYINEWNLTDPFNCDIEKIIESKKDDKDIQLIKRELCEVADKQRGPTTPESINDSAYESDECSLGSPSSVTSGVSRTDREPVVTVSTAPYTHVATQLTNLHTQSGFAPAPISPVIQTTVPLQPAGLFLMLPQQPKPAMPPPPPLILQQPQQQPQPLAPPSTPPLSPQVQRPIRPILPGINIPPACNRCNEPAIKRIKSVMVEQMKDNAWSLMFGKYPETKFTEPDEDGNMFLSCVLSNWQKIKFFMEVLYALIHRLKEIINNNRQMAFKLLATPNKAGHTPLDIACHFLRSKNPQNALAIRFLADTMVEEGLAIGEEVDANGNSLLHKLCEFGDDACYIMAELLSMKDRQGNRVFDVNHENNDGRTPLHIAAQNHSDRTSCTVLAQLLMRSGADVSMKERCAGNTVFHLIARESCDPNLLVTLLAKTTSPRTVINEKNFNEDTPLHMVAANHTIPPTRQRLAVQHLIEYGADPTLKNRSRQAPLSLVPTERKPDIKNVLYHKRHILCQE